MYLSDELWFTVYGMSSGLSICFFPSESIFGKIHKKEKTTGIPVVFPLSTLTVGFDLQEAQGPTPQGNGGGGEDGGAEDGPGALKVGDA